MYKILDRGRGCADERNSLDKRNRVYNCELKYEAEVMELLDFNLPPNEWSEVNPAKLSGFIKGTTANQIGRILTKISDDDERIVKKKNKYNTFYMLPLKKCLLKQSERW